jgi:glyoxylase-like metal-dependent hydrolase (beta-lactamase superfamily II)
LDNLICTCSILGHMHLDHAGGLDQFLDRKDIEIWVHDKELRSAFWSVATGADVGVYLQHYMDVRNIKTPKSEYSLKPTLALTELEDIR